MPRNLKVLLKSSNSWSGLISQSLPCWVLIFSGKASLQLQHAFFSSPTIAICHTSSRSAQFASDWKSHGETVKMLAQVLDVATVTVENATSALESWCWQYQRQHWSYWGFCRQKQLWLWLRLQRSICRSRYHPVTSRLPWRMREVHVHVHMTFLQLINS